MFKYVFVFMLFSSLVKSQILPLDSAVYVNQTQYIQFIEKMYMPKRIKADNLKMFAIKINLANGFMLIHNTYYHKYTWLSIAASSVSLRGASTTFNLISVTKKIRLNNKVKKRIL